MEKLQQIWHILTTKHNIVLSVKRIPKEGDSITVEDENGKKLKAVFKELN